MLITMIALAAALAGGTASRAEGGDLASLAEAERAFARHCVKDGVRASFLAHFAPDGIVLAPEPVNALAVYGARPAPAARPPVTLAWEPVTGDVAASGELGWTAGPYTLRDDTGQEPTGHGHYLSVWKRGADGTWKVAADAGIDHPEPAGERPAFARASATPAVTGAAPGLAELLALDRAAGRGCAPGDCLAERLDHGARLHRPGAAPVVGASGRASLRAEGPRAFEPLGGESASSGDLAYTWGRYRAQRGDGRTDGEGFYLHVWRRTAAGWRLQAEVAKPAERAPQP